MDVKATSQVNCYILEVGIVSLVRATIAKGSVYMSVFSNVLGSETSPQSLTLCV